MTTVREIKKVLKLPENGRFTWNMTGHGASHFTVFGPSGEVISGISERSYSGFSWGNFIADLRRGGVHIPRKNQKKKADR